MEEIIVGVVGVLQFEVLEYRLKNEYGVDIRLEPLPYEHIRWIENPEEIDVNRIVGTSDMKKIKDLKGNPLLVFANSWSVNMVLERNEGLKLSEFGRNQLILYIQESGDYMKSGYKCSAKKQPQLVSCYVCLC